MIPKTSNRRLPAGLAFFFLAAFPAAGLAQPIALGPGPHLFIDDTLIDSQEGLERRIVRPARQPWPVVTGGPQDRNFQPYVTVIRDARSGRFRIWYDVPENEQGSHLATMESEDGIRWIRPHRVLADPTPIQFGASIIDEGAESADPSNRFKLGYYHGRGLCVAASPDGLSWKPLAAKAVLEHDHDINSIFRDPIRKRYIAMVSTYGTGEKWSGRRRFTLTSTSEDLIHWRKPWAAIRPDEKDEGETQFYCMAGIIARGDLLIGTLKVLRDDLPADAGGPARGIGTTALAWSRDGEHWERSREPFFDRNPEPGSWDHAMAWMDCQLLVGDETFIYYGGYARGHKVERFTERQIGLARMPRDRYVARATAGDRPGRLRAPPLTLGARSMTVNARVEGDLRARILDLEGKPLPGFEDSDPIRGDSVAHAVRWKGDLAGLKDRPVRLEFSLRNGALFGFDLGGGG